MAVYLVAYSSHYEGRLRLPWPCGWLLRRSSVRLLWSRDPLTAMDLARQLRRPVDFVGNPFLDGEGTPATLPPFAGDGAVLGLLPGSRLPEALSNLLLLLDVLCRLPPEWHGRLRLLAALVPSLAPEVIVRAAAPHGWTLTSPSGAAGDVPRLRRGALCLELIRHHFWGVLRSSDLLLAMAGTAAELAVALGKPVLQVAGPGPQFTEGFADAQRRLLGPAVSCAPGPMGASSTLRETARMASEQLERRADPVEGPRWREQLRRLALERLGGGGRHRSHGGGDHGQIATAEWPSRCLTLPLSLPPPERAPLPPRKTEPTGWNVSRAGWIGCWCWTFFWCWRVPFGLGWGWSVTCAAPTACWPSSNGSGSPCFSRPWGC
jgi:uncharacterized protein (TIGR03492 family)